MASDGPPRSRLAPTPVIPPLTAAPPPLSRSSSHSSDSSHSSHSSVQARKREEAFGTAELPSVTKPAWSLIGILTLFMACHAAGLYLFTQGFLLTRSEVTGVAQCSGPKPAGWKAPLPRALAEGVTGDDLRQWDQALQDDGECTLSPAFDRSLLLVIDALRYDFIAAIEASAATSGNWTPSPFYHSQFTTPSTLDRQHPRNSVLAHFLSDAPTTTLQRLKGLTTGTLPTFIDAGSNFGGEAIGEDNWISQLRKKPNGPAGMSFVGDDTWLKIYPDLFDVNSTYPFDSFNVEDLHSVDNGVKKHLMEFLRADKTSVAADWKLLIAHTLGVDHVGHRHTPAHPLMKAKLNEMDAFVSQILDRLPEDALFILAGDHGMDAQGDHGGEGELEVGSGIWIYSKKGFSPSVASFQEQAEFEKDLEALRDASRSSDATGPSSHRSFAPLGQTLHRSFPQVDLVPSISLLLGVPPPFGNLGTVIPELFQPSKESEPSRLLRALRINARQIRTYLRASGSDLKAFEGELEGHFLRALHLDATAAKATRGKDYYIERREAIVAYQNYNRLALDRARSVWAKFSVLKIAGGLSLIVLSILSSLKVISLLRTDGAPEKRVTTVAVAQSLFGMFARGSLSGVSLAAGATAFVRRQSQVGRVVGTVLDGVKWTDWLVFGLFAGGQLAVLFLQAEPESTGQPSAAEDIKQSYQGKAIQKGKKASKTLEKVEATSTVTKQSLYSSTWTSTMCSLAPVLLHATLFASNSLTVWEDSIVHGLLIAILLWRAWRGWAAGGAIADQVPNSSSATIPSAAPSNPSKAIASRAQQRIPFLLGVSAVLLRAVKEFKVCREEQAPSCVGGFFHLQSLSTLLAAGPISTARLALWIPPVAALVGSYALSYILPNLLLRSLRQSKSDTGLVHFWADWLFRPCLMLGSGWWIVDWVGEGLTTSASPQQSSGALAAVQWGKNLIARVDLAIIVVVGTSIWFFAPLCLQVKEETINAPGTAPRQPAGGMPPSPPTTAADANQTQQRRVQLLGFSNVFGSSYLLFFSLIFALCWLVTPTAGQLTLAVAFFVVIALAEAGDAERDLVTLRRLLASQDGSLASLTTAASRTPTILEMTTLHLLAHALFFSTGHQATFLSIQWRSAFIGTSSVVYPWSPLLVILNSFGPLTLLPALALPLFLSWNLAPTPRGPTTRPMTTPRSLLISALTFMVITSIVTLSTAIFAAHFKRHLMLFKIWAPRYMLGGIGLMGIDLGLIMGSGAWCVIAGKVAQTLGSSFE